MRALKHPGSAKGWEGSLSGAGLRTLVLKIGGDLEG